MAESPVTSLISIAVACWLVFCVLWAVVDNKKWKAAARRRADRKKQHARENRSIAEKRAELEVPAEKFSNKVRSSAIARLEGNNKITLFEVDNVTVGTRNLLRVRVEWHCDPDEDVELYLYKTSQRHMYASPSECAKAEWLTRIWVRRHGEPISYVDTDIDETETYTYYVWLHAETRIQTKKVVGGVPSYYTDTGRIQSEGEPPVIENRDELLTRDFHFRAERKSVIEGEVVYLDDEEPEEESPDQNDPKVYLQPVIDEILLTMEIEREGTEYGQEKLATLKAEGLIDEEDEEYALNKIQQKIYQVLEDQKEKRGRA